MKIPKEFYTLPELSKKRWNLTEDEILNLAFAGKFFISVFWGGPYLEGQVDPRLPFFAFRQLSAKGGGECLQDFVHLDTKAIRFFLAPRVDGEEEVQVAYSCTRDGRRITLTIKSYPPLAYLKHNPSIDADQTKKANEAEKNPLFPTFSRSKLVILTEEVEKYEEANPHIIKHLTDEDIENEALIGKVLDHKHCWHSEPLAIAVKAWLHIYGNRPGNKDDNRYRPNKGNDEEINKFLETFTKKNNLNPIGVYTRKHYHAIVNPSKQGGTKKN